MKRFIGYELASNLTHMPCVHKRILLRVDLNVPMQNGIIADDFRLQALQPTLDFLLHHNARVLLVTHLGRPKNQEDEFSTQQLLPWFGEHGYQVTFAATLPAAQQALADSSTCVLLENIRFWPQEKAQDLAFAQQMRACTDAYVLDAFGAVHRAETSLSVLPTLYESHERTIGFLIAREIQAMNNFLQSASPVMAVVGGAKVGTKLPLLEKLLVSCDILALLPPLSCVQAQVLDTLCEHAQKMGKKVLIPRDYMVGTQDWNGPYHVRMSSELDAYECALTIGPQTVADYSSYLQTARAVFFNGLSGDCAYPETTMPMRALIQALDTSCVYSIVAGGDSVRMVHLLRLVPHISFLSTGGGACLAYLTGGPLPALEVFINRS